MAPLRQTAFRLDDQDLELLDAIKQEMGFSARSDALRYALRQFARQRDLTTREKPKRRSKPKR